MNLVLRQLTLDDESVFFEGLQLFSDMERSWYASHYKDGMSFLDLFQILENERKGINLKEGRVPATMMYGFLDGKIVGRLQIRHYLNDYLAAAGGHIGYAVASKFRRQGIAGEMLRQSLPYCRDILKLEKVLVTCDEDNVGSMKTIERNGGEFENRYVSNDGTEMKRRYWIKL